MYIGVLTERLLGNVSLERFVVKKVVFFVSLFQNKKRIVKVLMNTPHFLGSALNKTLHILVKFLKEMKVYIVIWHDINLMYGIVQNLKTGPVMYW